MNQPEEHPLNALTEQTSDEERKKQVYTQKSLRTLEGDIREAVEERNVSSASIVMAEQEKVSSSSIKQKQQPSNLKKKSIIVLVSVLLVALGIGGAYYLYIKSPLAPVAPSVPKAMTISSIVSADMQKTLDVSGLGSGATKAAVKNALTNVGGENGSILQIIPVEKGSAGSENIVNANNFLTQASMPVPDVLFRSLGNLWMLGTYNDNGTAAPFIILTNNFFQNAYAGMIAWEKTMPDDFVNVFGYADTTALPISFASTSPTSTSALPNFASSTATSSIPSFVYTSPISSYFTIQGSFKDGVIKNKDVRAFTESDGTILVLYSFVDNNTIVITTDENALAEIINRLEKQTFIR
jgi:hypothetical protein